MNAYKLNQARSILQHMIYHYVFKDSINATITITGPSKDYYVTQAQYEKFVSRLQQCIKDMVYHYPTIFESHETALKALMRYLDINVLGYTGKTAYIGTGDVRYTGTILIYTKSPKSPTNNDVNEKFIRTVVDNIPKDLPLLFKTQDDINGSFYGNADESFDGGIAEVVRLGGSGLIPSRPANSGRAAAQSPAAAAYAEATGSKTPSPKGPARRRAPLLPEEIETVYNILVEDTPKKDTPMHSQIGQFIKVLNENGEIAYESEMIDDEKHVTLTIDDAEFLKNIKDVLFRRDEDKSENDYYSALISRGTDTTIKRFYDMVRSGSVPVHTYGGGKRRRTHRKHRRTHKKRHTKRRKTTHKRRSN